MAQTGFTPIQLYYSTTASQVPSGANLAAGELAINITDGKLYFKNNSNVVTLLADQNTVAGGVTSISVASANGFAGTSSGGNTPTLTLSTSITGVLKGNGTAISAATAGTDFVLPGGALGTPSSGTLTNCTGYTTANLSGSINLATQVTGTLPVANGGTGRTTNTAYAVICGGTTTGGAEQSIASVGTAGQVLTSNGAGALPTFQAAGGGFASGTVMLFGQTAAPTGWTKDTTNFDNSSLRVVTGTASSGGSVNFTTAFASQTPTGSVSISSVSGSAGATTLTTPQIPSHSHPISTRVSSGIPGTVLADNNQAPNSTANTNATGGDGSHTHPFSFSSGSGTFSGNAINLAVKYVDVIRATKD
jgi:hypothetical protein